MTRKLAALSIALLLAFPGVAVARKPDHEKKGASEREHEQGRRWWLLRLPAGIRLVPFDSLAECEQARAAQRVTSNYECRAARD